MDIPRFHRPQWADICDDCAGFECTCGKQAKLVMGCECSQHRSDLIKLLKELQVSPARFQGIFQQEHKPCKMCTKHIYDHLKRDKANRSLKKPRPSPHPSPKSSPKATPPKFAPLPDAEPMTQMPPMPSLDAEAWMPALRLCADDFDRSLPTSNFDIDGFDYDEPVDERASQITTKTKPSVKSIGSKDAPAPGIRIELSSLLSFSDEAPRDSCLQTRKLQSNKKAVRFQQDYESDKFNGASMKAMSNGIVAMEASMQQMMMCQPMGGSFPVTAIGGVQMMFMVGGPQTTDCGWSCCSGMPMLCSKADQECNITINTNHGP